MSGTMSTSGDPIVATGSGFTDTSGSQTASLTDEQMMQTAMQAWGTNPALQTYIQQNYGYDAWMLSDPELSQVLITAAYYGWDQAHIDGALFKTNWWKTNGQSVRAFQELQATDPATAQQQIGQMRNTIAVEANDLGVMLPDQEITQLASQAVEFNWDSNTIRNVVAGQYATANTGKTPTSGVAADFSDQAKQLVQQYMVPMAQPTIDQWTQNAVLGKADISGFEDYLRGQAQSMYPWMKTAIDQGMTPQSWFQPYTQTAASVLGVSPDTVNWTDPKWLSALTNTNPDGSTAPVNLTQFTNTLRTNPAFGYQFTADARQQAYTMASTIAKTFGKVAA